MRMKTLLGEVLPVLGMVGLLGLWLYQQTGIESRASELRKIAAARAVYQTYQSHNAVFNAINEVVASPKASSNLRNYQTYNYELGLNAIEQILPAELKTGIPPAINAYDGTVTFDKKMERTQKRLELLQGKLTDYESSLRAAAAHDRTTYLVLYLAISALSIIGALSKVADKVAFTTAPNIPRQGFQPSGKSTPDS
jgi:hypothetical protein